MYFLLCVLCAVELFLQTLHRLTARAIIRDWEEGALHPDPLEHEVPNSKPASSIIAVACNLRICAVCRLHGAKYAVCRLHGTQSADCMVTVQTKDPSKTCDSF